MSLLPFYWKLMWLFNQWIPPVDIHKNMFTNIQHNSNGRYYAYYDHQSGEMVPFKLHRCCFILTYNIWITVPGFVQCEHILWLVNLPYRVWDNFPIWIPLAVCFRVWLSLNPNNKLISWLHVKNKNNQK